MSIFKQTMFGRWREIRRRHRAQRDLRAALRDLEDRLLRDIGFPRRSVRNPGCSANTTIPGRPGRADGCRHAFIRRSAQFAQKARATRMQRPTHDSQRTHDRNHAIEGLPGDPDFGGNPRCQRLAECGTDCRHASLADRVTASRAHNTLDRHMPRPTPRTAWCNRDYAC